MRPIYDVQCSRCGRQLDFFETADAEGDGLILVDPCPSCTGAEEGPDNELAPGVQGKP